MNINLFVLIKICNKRLLLLLQRIQKKKKIERVYATLIFNYIFKSIGFVN